MLARSFFCIATPSASTVHQAAMSHISEDETIWRRRLAKRLAGVRYVKASPEYAACCVRPATPDPFDRTVSKRHWERTMQEFRRVLRDQAPQSPIDWLGGVEAEEPPAAAAASFLCGCWEDQRGSVYKLLPGREGAFHVETTRPSGQTRFTRDLVRVALARGREKTIWGCCRYELERCGSNALLWRGLSERDTFLWRRVVPEDC